MLVFTDYPAIYTQAYPTRNKASRTATERIFNYFILNFCIPQHIFHDQGKEFDNKFFHQLTKLCGVNQLSTTQYHPQINGSVERMNSMTFSMLKTLTDKGKTSRKDHINNCIFAYSCTKHSFTRCSPYHLLFRYKPHFPTDLTLGQSEASIRHSCKLAEGKKSEG